ncbi:phage tail protein [Roseateles koreensis]|uniref:Tail fiber protein n=1 Tax=Roseateles koreensis TaxID=2987526 RepID=A0ABT5KXJ7_9BURK|nr:tail fiber protein [Roseateles koreensis]MDC8787073.1 tail fiber protein [Roseateles koreensis]
MGTPYLGEIRLMSFAYAPRGWAQCNGQLLPINQYQALFALLGTYYGGNGQSNFALPNLQGRTPLHVGPTTVQGQSGGAENVTLLQAHLPVHSHGLSGTSDLANASAPGLAVPAAKGRGGVNHYAGAGSVNASLDASSVSLVGGNQPHSNMQPYLVMNYVIALQGIFPSRN